MVVLGREILTDFEFAASREWLETNGIGGYASGTLSGANSRRYHGLLVAAARPPLGRMVLLSKFEESLIIDGERYELSCNRYPGAIYPEGYKYITGFRLDPYPVWTYEVAAMTVERSVFMLHGENSTVIRWKAVNAVGKKVEIELKPLLAFRDHHHLRQWHDDFVSCQVSKGIVSIRPESDGQTLYLAHSSAELEHQGHWYRDLEYPIERERGFDHHEDLYQPFSLRFDLTSDAVVIASTEIRNAADAMLHERSEIARRTDLITKAGFDDAFCNQLACAADQFIVSRGDGKTVIAGYPWFSDWGRDTMIALNGLTLVTGRPEIAKSILLEFSKHISEGMLPNRFPDVGETPEYNTVDATLWYFEAIRAYVEKTDDDDLVRGDLYEKLVNVIEWHIRGTRYGIHVDTDGLLFAGEPGVQLTWMDAKIGDWVVTPRTGKSVEIQALWYNALCVMADLAERFGDTDGRHMYTNMAAAAKASFNGQFWNDGEDCLFDVINGLERDAAVRPNQILAVSLPYSMLDEDKARHVVIKVESDLLTPIGLRSLSPRDRNYVPVYKGSPVERDAAYHQGTVWAWLIGPFIDAYRRVHRNSPDANDRVVQFLDGLKTHLSAEGMVGQISEIFDADPPHAARGCPAQAWSVAELLRISAEGRDPVQTGKAG